MNSCEKHFFQRDEWRYSASVLITQIPISNQGNHIEFTNINGITTIFITNIEMK